MLLFKLLNKSKLQNLYQSQNQLVATYFNTLNKNGTFTLLTV